MEQPISHRTNFHGIRNLNVFNKSVEKIHVSINSDKNNWHFSWRPKCVFDCISPSSSQNENFFRQRCRENQNTHFMLNSPPPPRKSCLLWDKLEKKIIELGRPQMNIRHTRIACWTLKATITHSECVLVILIAFPLQKMVAGTRLRITSLRTFPVLFILSLLLEDTAVLWHCLFSLMSSDISIDLCTLIFSGNKPWILRLMLLHLDIWVQEWHSHKANLLNDDVCFG